MKKNVVARSGRAVEAAGDVDILFLDKTGTITFGDRRAEAVFPAEGVTREEALQAAYYASAADPTPEGRSLASFAAGKLGRSLKVLPDEAAFIPFSAQSRMSGVSFSGATYRRRQNRTRGPYGARRRCLRTRLYCAHCLYGRKSACRRRTQRYRQTRYCRAVCTVKAHGGPHGDDYRGQYAYGCNDCFGSRSG